MTMDLRIVYDTGDDDELTLENVPLGAPGDEGSGAVLLTQVALDATIGSDALEVTDSGDVVATVAGVNYVVGLAQVRHTGTHRLDDSLVFFGIPTSYTPGDNSAGA
jgi:hypothetical protein